MLLDVALVVLLAAASGSAAELDEEALREAVTRVLHHAENSHYLNIRVDDRISRATLDNFLAALDDQRLFFTVEDEERLRVQYQDQLDDAMREGHLDPLFEIHRHYLHRHAEFRDFARNYLRSRPNLNTTREWLLDRSAAPQPANRAEQEELWRDWIRHDWISLMLEGRSYGAARAWLLHLYRFGDPLSFDADRPGSDAHDSGTALALFLNSFARALDSNSSYSSPESIWGIAERLEDVGRVTVGLALEGEYIAVREQAAEVPAVTEGGLQAGDRIIGVDPFGDGEIIDVVGWQPFEIHKLMSGPTGTTVVFRVLPASGEAGTLERRMERISIVPEEMKRAMRWTPKWIMERGMNKMLQSEMKARKTVLDVEESGQTLQVGVIRIPAIYGKCTRDVKRLLGELKDEGVDALVVDLRGNSLGEGDAVVSLTGLFVGKGPISQDRDRKGKVRVLRNRRQEAIWDGPLAVLVNRWSSAASEVFAAAIQDYGRGVVVGGRTFGKGTTQAEYKVKPPTRGKSFDATLRITTHEVYRVTGGRIRLRGVSPDISLSAARIDPSPTGFPSLLADPSRRERASIHAMPAQDIPAVDFRRRELPLLPLDELLAGHQRRESRNPDWRLMVDHTELSRNFMERQTEPIHLDRRRENRQDRWLAEVALAKAWLEAKGSANAEVERALAEYLLRFEERILQDGVAPAGEEPVLMQAILRARGYAAVLDEGEFHPEAYDLPLQQSAMIVVTLGQLREDTATAFRGRPQSGSLFP